MLERERERKPDLNGLHSTSEAKQQLPGIDNSSSAPGQVLKEEAGEGLEEVETRRGYKT